MKNIFIATMFIFWGFVVAIISAGYVVKQNRLAQESMQKTYIASIQQITEAYAKGKTTGTLPVSVVTTPKTINKPVVTKPGTTPTPVPAPVVPSGPTLALVATHNTQSDCWIVVNGNVYSVAAYISMHPGGARRIIDVCGSESTSMFSGTSGGHRHSSYAQSLLGQYLVGKLQ
jgi:hypothetical protein